MKWKKAGRVAAIILAAVLVTGGTFAALSQLLAANPPPTLHIHGMEFRVDKKGGIQALVTVALKNVAMADGAAILLPYNDTYLVPSDAVTNDALTTNATQAFFTPDEKMMLQYENASVSPFVATVAEGGSIRWGYVDTANKTLSISLFLDQEKAKNPEYKTGEGRPIQRENIAEGESDTNKFFYFAADPTGVVLGTLSFQVKEEKLSEMVEKFSKADAGEDLLGTNKKPTNRIINYFYLQNGAYTSGSYVGDAAGPDGSGPAEVIIDYEFPPTLVRAELAETAVTVNAYQAYTDGTAADIAAVLQKYSPTVTEGYANGNFVSKLLTWGKVADGYLVEKKTGGTDEAPAWTPMDGTTVPYDRLGGTYRVSQNYYYLNAKGVRTQYPKPMVATLVVTPVTLEGVAAADLEKTYQSGAATDNLIPPETYRGLKLPREATLAVTPVPGTVSLVIPVPGWVPADTGKQLAEWLETKDTAPVIWPNIGDYAFATGILPGDVQAAYPWLTVPQLAPLPLNAVRKIVAAPTDAAAYQTAAAADDNGTLQIRVHRVDTAKMGDSAFRVCLPNGAEVLSVWFEPEGENLRKFQWVADGGGYSITIQAGESDTAVPDYLAQRDAVRRYINLGGWFSVAVREGADTPYSDFIPTYSAPRNNSYLKNNIEGTVGASNGGQFDFTGYRGGVFPFYPMSVLGQTVVLPTGYSVETTYDGATGEEGGRLSTVRAETAWGLAGADKDGGTVTRDPATGWPSETRVSHGPQEFAAAAYFDGYGKVVNLARKQVKIKTQVQAGAAPVESVQLLGPDEAGIFKVGGEVTRAVYNTRQVGYTNRQAFTLTLKNSGTTDIYGLYLDMAHSPNPGGTNHFEIIKQPAAYLPAGTTTTFVVTYVYNLSAAISASTDYKDKIAIRSNGGALLKEFDAEFQVSDGVVSTVRVKTNNDKMGTAKIVTGLAAGQPPYNSAWKPGETVPGTVKPDTAAGLTSYVEKYQWVWIYAQPDDEYLVEKVYYYLDDSEAMKIMVPLYTYAYEAAAADPDTGKKETMTAYFFQMPDHDVTVHVDFYEPVSSKLRLSKLQVYGALAKSDVTTIVDDTNLQKLLRGDDTTVVVDGGNLQAPPPPMPDNRSVNDFTVVLPKLTETDEDKAMAQVSISLRQLLAGLPDTENIKPKVKMSWFNVAADGTESLGGWIYSDTSGTSVEGTTAIDGATDTPLAPSDHVSLIFPAPPEGEFIRVKIELEYTYKGGEDTNVTENRTYTVKLVRPGEQIQTLGYGNSPYGMIRNDAGIADWAGAQTAFAKDRRFLGDANTPAKAKKLTNTYWSEAWGGAETPEAGNLDMDEHALFLCIGENFDDPGVTGVRNSAADAVPPADIKRTVTVDLLDTTKTLQTERFSGTGTAILDLGTADKAQDVTDWWKDAEGGAIPIRPGVYDLVYSYLDFDGKPENAKQFTRKLVILPPVGDVNADGAVTAKAPDTDEGLIQNRIGDPLGYAVDSTKYPWASLFKYRVCDANNDRNINNIDGNLLHKGTPAPTRFYLPTGYR